MVSGGVKWHGRQLTLLVGTGGKRWAPKAKHGRGKFVGSGHEWQWKRVMGARREWWVPLAKGKWWAPEANGGHWRRHLADASGGRQRQMVGGGVEGQLTEPNSEWQRQCSGGGRKEIDNAAVISAVCYYSRRPLNQWPDATTTLASQRSMPCSHLLQLQCRGQTCSKATFLT